MLLYHPILVIAHIAKREKETRKKCNIYTTRSQKRSGVRDLSMRWWHYCIVSSGVKYTVNNRTFSYLSLGQNPTTISQYYRAILSRTFNNTTFWSHSSIIFIPRFFHLHTCIFPQKQMYSYKPGRAFRFTSLRRLRDLCEIFTSSGIVLKIGIFRFLLQNQNENVNENNKETDWKGTFFRWTSLTIRTNCECNDTKL